MTPPHDFWSTLILLLLILDPFGNMPVFLAVTRQVPGRRRAWITLRESAIAYAVLLAFMAGGRRFLELLGLRQASLEVAGGVILLLVAIKMIFSSAETMFSERDLRDPLIFPLAVPLLAGPSALAAVLLFSSASGPVLALRIGALSAAVAITAALLLVYAYTPPPVSVEPENVPSVTPKIRPSDASTILPAGCCSVSTELPKSPTTVSAAFTVPLPGVNA